MPSKQVTIQGVMTWEDSPGAGQPPYPSQGPGFPTQPIQLPPWAGGWQPHPSHPIAPGGPPLGFWGGVAPPWVSHPIAPGGPEVTHPIAPGGPPPGIWGGRPPWVDHTLPLPQPPFPPLGFWGGRPPEYVDIGLPLPQPPGGGTQPPESGIDDKWHWGWSPFYGWVVLPPGGGGKPVPPAVEKPPYVPPPQPPGVTHPIQPTVPEPKK